MTDPDTSSNKELVLRFSERVSDESDPNNVLSAMKLFADDSEFRVMASYGMGGIMTKAETTQKNVEILTSVKGRMKFKIHSITAEQDRVAVEAENTCVLVDGQTYDNFYVFLFVIKNGRIQRVNEYLDTLYLSKTYRRLSNHPAVAPRAKAMDDAPAADHTYPTDRYFEHPLRSY